MNGILKEIGKLRKMKEALLVRIEQVEAEKGRHEQKRAELQEKLNHMTSFDIKTEKKVVPPGTQIATRNWCL